MNTLQHPGIWHKRNGVFVRGRGCTVVLAALAGRSESLETVQNVGVDWGLVDMVPVHCRSHL